VVKAIVLSICVRSVGAAELRPGTKESAMKNNKVLTRAAKKYYTIPDGTYNGTWSAKNVWLKNECNEVFARIDVKDSTRGNRAVIIDVAFPKIFIYGNFAKKDR
jgi:hypothetical protein